MLKFSVEAVFVVSDTALAYFDLPKFLFRKQSHQKTSKIYIPCSLFIIPLEGRISNKEFFEVRISNKDLRILKFSVEAVFVVSDSVLSYFYSPKFLFRNQTHQETSKINIPVAELRLVSCSMRV